MNELTKKVLVTGGTGFIGSALVKRLVSDGHAVRVMDSNIRGTQERLHDVIDKIECVQADVRNLDEVQRACQGVDAIHHLAFINGTEYFYQYPELVLEIAVKGMMNVLDVCKEQGIRKLFVASSSETYHMPTKIPTDETVPLVIPDTSNPRYSYSAGKILWEMLAINYGRKYFDKVVIYRPHNVYGPDMGYEHVLPQFALRMHQLLNEHPTGEIPFPIQGSGEETRAFVHINDFIDGVMIATEKGDHLGTYHIGTMKEQSINDVVRLMGELVKREVRIIPGELTKGGTLRRCPDTTKLQKLGYNPKVEFKQGVQELMSWYERNPTARKITEETQ